MAKSITLHPHPRGASSLTDAAYRFVRHEPGVHIVLFGTSDLDHLKMNVESFLKPPLPVPDCQKLADLFDHLLGVELELPGAINDGMNRT